MALQRGELNAAKEYYERSLELSRSVFTHPYSLASVYRGLGTVSLTQGNIFEAMKYHEQALALEASYDEPRSLPFELAYLARLAHYCGDEASSRQYYERIRKLYEQVSHDSIEAANVLACLGNLARLWGDDALAQQYYEKTLAILRKARPDEDEIIATLIILGEIASNFGNEFLARTYYEEAFSIQQRYLRLQEYLAPDTMNVVDQLSRLGKLAYRLGKLELSLSYYNQVLGICEKIAPASASVANILITYKYGGYRSITRKLGSCSRILEACAKYLKSPNANLLRSSLCSSSISPLCSSPKSYATRA